MKNIVNPAVKFALLFSVLSANITVSYADAEKDKFEKIKSESAKISKDGLDNKVIFDKFIDQAKKDLASNQDELTALEKIGADVLGSAGHMQADFADIQKQVEKNQPNLNKSINETSTLVNVYDPLLSGHEKNRNAFAKNNEIVKGLQKQFNNIKDEFKDYKKATNGAIAGVAAMGMLTAPQGIGHTAVSAGAGYYGSQSAIAVGVTHQIDALTIRAGASYSTGSKQPVLGAGIGYEF